EHAWVLDLSANSLTGKIPPCIGNTSVDALDLRLNRFDVEIPSTFADGNVLRRSYRSCIEIHGRRSNYKLLLPSVTVVLKGFFVDFTKIQTIFTTIDFSKNNFKGEIPKMIGTLKSLKGLNFTGTIPTSLGNLTNLEWLDLSSNQLVGEIPKQLADLTSLEVLNLSHNQLVGAIPHGKQFNTFEMNHTVEI
ncbi:LOW QUALITY PROTEIN: LRR domain containing protein, partial [Parasponia andersonii]